MVAAATAFRCGHDHRMGNPVPLAAGGNRLHWRDVPVEVREQLTLR
jgi:hypothetical protein